MPANALGVLPTDHHPALSIRSKMEVEKPGRHKHSIAFSNVQEFAQNCLRSFFALTLKEAHACSLLLGRHKHEWTEK